MPRYLLLSLLALGCGGATRAPAKPQRAPVRAAEPPRELNQESIRHVVRENMPQLRACYMESGARKQGLSGQVSTVFVVGSDGSVVSATEVHDAPSRPEFALTDYEAARSSARFPDPNVPRCVARVFRGMRFPKPKSGTLTVVYPLIFKTE